MINKKQNSKLAKPEYFSMQDFIDWIQRYIIIHSYHYYEDDCSFISDKEYDAVCKQLVELKKEYPELWKSSQYYKQFGDDYNGATGFTLFHDLDEHQKEIILSITRSHSIKRK